MTELGPGSGSAMAESVMVDYEVEELHTLGIPTLHRYTCGRRHYDGDYIAAFNTVTRG